MNLRKQNPHDKFAHKFFTNLSLTREFITIYTPELAAKIDLSTLKLIDTKFVDPDYREHRTDLLFQVMTLSGEPLFILPLIEHKSYPEKETLLQILRDMLGKWEQELKNGAKQLTPIVPILFYHDESAWPYPADFREMFPTTPLWDLFIPGYQVILQDFSYQTNRPLEGSHMLQSILRAFRFARAEKKLDLNVLLVEIAPEGIDMSQPILKFLADIVYYLMEATHTATPEALNYALQHQGEIGGNIVQTAAVKLRNEGEKIGLERGQKIGLERGQKIGLEKGERLKAIEIAKQMLKAGKFSTAEISKFTGLSISDIRKL